MHRGLALAVVSLVAHGCAPAASFRPAAPLLEGQQFEVGAGAVAVSPRPYVQTDEWRGGGQAWGTWAAASWLELSLIAAADPEAALGGVAGRLRLFDADRFASAFDLELGFAWATVSLPIAVRLFDWTWIYATPAVGSWGRDVTVRGALGLSVRVVERLFVRVESQLNYPTLDAYQRRVHLGAALAWQM